jgi:Arylsulfatase regulator (Fe-S oxidoreductase)
VPVPTKITDLSTTAASNSPQGGDTVGVLMDDYLRGIQQVIRKETFHNVLLKTGAYTVTSDDINRVIACDAVTGGITISLPAAATLTDGFAVTIIKIDSAENFVTIDADGAETIDGEPTFILWRELQSVTITSDGLNWFIVNENNATHENRNLILNGAQRFWSEKTFYTGITTGKVIHDKYRFNIAGSGTWKAERSTDVPTFAQARKVLEYSVKFTVTTADATVSSTDHAEFTQLIEGRLFKQAYKRPLSVRLWMKSNKVGNYYCAFRSGVLDASYVTKWCCFAADTWELKKVRMTAPPTIGTWAFTAATGLDFSIVFVAGSALQASTPDVWLSGNRLGESGVVNVADAVNNYINITDLRVVMGPDPDDLAMDMDIDEESYLLRRYREKSYALDTVTGTVETGTEVVVITPNAIADGAVLHVKENFLVYKRASPTLTLFSSSGVQGSVTVGGTDRTASVSQVSARGIIHITNTSGVTWAAGSTVAFHYYADSEL